MRNKIMFALILGLLFSACKKEPSTDAAKTNLVGVTVAGGNGKGAAANQLDDPTDVVVDNSGAIYISDVNNHRIQKWAPGASEGVTIVGGYDSPAKDSYILGAHNGIFLDASSNLYVAETGRNRIRKWALGVNPMSGVTVAGRPPFSGSGPMELNIPWAVFVDRSDNIYIADRLNHRIQKWTVGATSGTTVAGSTGQSGNDAKLLKDPFSVFVDVSNNIYIADRGNSRIQKWTPGASNGITVAGGAPQNFDCADIFVDASGNIYVADPTNHRIQKWAPGASSGTTVAGGNGVGSNANQLNSPTGVFVDAVGNIFVADRGNSRIQKWAQK